MCCGSSDTEDAEVTNCDASISQETKPLLSNALNTTLLGLFTDNDLEQAHRCLSCGQCFSRPKLLGEHLKTVHRAEGKAAGTKRKLKPPQSGRESPYSLRLRVNRTPPAKQHQSIKLRKAPRTVRRSRTRSAKAPAREDSEKPHACGVCGRQFRIRRDLDLHDRIHSGIKPNECPDCGRQFTTVSQLRSHFRTHTQEAIYSCGSCGEKFVWLNSLKRHQRIHQDTDNTDVGELSCDVCSESFDSRQQFDSHNLLVHGVVGNSSLPDVDQSAYESQPVQKKKTAKRKHWCIAVFRQWHILKC